MDPEPSVSDKPQKSQQDFPSQQKPLSNKFKPFGQLGASDSQNREGNC